MKYGRMFIEAVVIAAFLAWLWIALVIGASFTPMTMGYFGHLISALGG